MVNEKFCVRFKFLFKLTPLCLIFALDQNLADFGICDARTTLRTIASCFSCSETPIFIPNMLIFIKKNENEDDHHFNQGAISRSEFEVRFRGPPLRFKVQTILVFIYIINSPMVKETTGYVLVLGPYNLTLDYKEIY